MTYNGNCVFREFCPGDNQLVNAPRGKVIFLPDTYQPNDRQRSMAAPPTRAQAGLPEGAIVLACFNQPYKITRQVFECWVDILRAVPQAVLWLLDDNPAARTRLRSEAGNLGVAPDRLLFAPRQPQEQHLARLSLADLALDCTPVGSHTTGSDALWAGVPLVALSGATFASRVAESLLHAVGLPELVTHNLEDYRRLVTGLASDSERLRSIRARLAEQRLNAPLFDSQRFVRNLEAGLSEVWRRHLEGLPPDHVWVKSSNTEDSSRLCKSLRQSLASGDLDEALGYAKQAMMIPGTPDDVGHLELAGLVFYNAGDFERARTCLRRAGDLQPKNASIAWNVAQTSLCMGDASQAYADYRLAMSLDPDFRNALQIGTRVHTAIGQFEEARALGELELNQADRMAPAPPIGLPEQPPKVFDQEDPARNIIAFSLWGNRPRYLEAAMENVRLWPLLYPEWMLRFYVESETVPPSVVRALTESGCQVVHKARQKNLYEGLFWRMQVIGDRGVDRFLQRDVDSVFSVKERLAVDEWLQSGKYFHVMRDSLTHLDLIQAGLWGGVGGVFPPLNELLSRFRLKQPPTRMIDQQFLSAVIWPTVKQSVLIHDSQFTAHGARPYSNLGPTPPGGYLGAPWKP